MTHPDHFALGRIVDRAAARVASWPPERQRAIAIKEEPMKLPWISRRRLDNAKGTVDEMAQTIAYQQAYIAQLEGGLHEMAKFAWDLFPIDDPGGPSARDRIRGISQAAKGEVPQADVERYHERHAA